jgi:excisionase family DNA binding protein
VNEDRYLTARELAEILGVSEDWVYGQAAAGYLPSYKFGGHRRFKLSEIKAWAAAHAVAEPKPSGQGRLV